jgi:UDP-glucuronate 4-epimerase
MLGAFAPHAGLRAAALRLFTVYGPRQRPDLAIHAFARRLHAGEPITVFGDGGQLRDFTYCGDIVAGILAATDWTARAPVGMDIFNLGGGHPVTLSTVIDLLGQAMKCVPRVEYRPPMPGDVRVTAADIAKARAVLGYAPRTAFAEGIRLFTVWFNDAIVRQS